MGGSFFERHAFICTSGKHCPNKGPVDDMLGMMRQEIKSRGLKEKIRVNKSGCFDWCDHGPVMVVYPEAVWYTNLDMEKAKEIFEEHIIKGNPVERLAKEQVKGDG